MFATVKYYQDTECTRAVFSTLIDTKEFQKLKQKPRPANNKPVLINKILILSLLMSNKTYIFDIVSIQTPFSWI